MEKIVKNSDSPFFLNELALNKLEDILALSDQEQYEYYIQLVRRFYPNPESEDKQKLIFSYKGSFELEYLLRTEPVIAQAFTCIYTRTGMIREVTNDLYFISDAYQYQIN
jgi:hypothetical protein